MKEVKKKEEEYTKFITEYTMNGELYGGEIYAKSEKEAGEHLKQRAKTEKIVGKVPDVVYII